MNGNPIEISSLGYFWWFKYIYLSHIHIQGHLDCPNIFTDRRGSWRFVRFWDYLRVWLPQPRIFPAVETNKSYTGHEWAWTVSRFHQFRSWYGYLHNTCLCFTGFTCWSHLLTFLIHLGCCILLRVHLPCAPFRHHSPFVEGILRLLLNSPL